MLRKYDDRDSFAAQLEEIAQEGDSDAQWEKLKELSNARAVATISLLPVLPMDHIWPDIPVAMPENVKKSRTTSLKDIWPKIVVLKRLGVREQGKMAKIIYSLHPFLTDEEIGRLFPAKLGTKTSKETDRDRGRILLGKKKPKKPPERKPKSRT